MPSNTAYFQVPRPRQYILHLDTDTEPDHPDPGHQPRPHLGDRRPAGPWQGGPGVPDADGDGVYGTGGGGGSHNGAGKDGGPGVVILRYQV